MCGVFHPIDKICIHLLLGMRILRSKSLETPKMDEYEGTLHVTNQPRWVVNLTNKQHTGL